MKLSTKGRYGLRAMVDLAVHSETGPVSIQSIANRQDISVSYLEQLVGKMRRAGLVTCKASQKCVTKYVWKKINESISQAVDTIMIEQLVQESKKVNGL